MEKIAYFTEFYANNLVNNTNKLLKPANATAGFCLLLTGTTLDLSTSLAAKRFCDKHNKKGALLAMEMLQRENLGDLIAKKACRGTSQVCVQKI